MRASCARGSVAWKKGRGASCRQCMAQWTQSTNMCATSRSARSWAASPKSRSGLVGSDPAGDWS
eukprot:8341617-Pyramimonas_sp.AAC.1